MTGNREPEPLFLIEIEDALSEADIEQLRADIQITPRPYVAAALQRHAPAIRHTVIAEVISRCPASSVSDAETCSTSSPEAAPHAASPARPASPHASTADQSPTPQPEASARHTEPRPEQ